MFKKITGIKHKLSSRAKISIIAASVLVTIGLAISAWFVWIQPYFQQMNNPPLTFEEKYAKIVLDTQTKIDNNDYSGALSNIDINISNSTEIKEKAELYILKSSTAFNIDKFDDARDYALKAEELDPSVTSADLLGDSLFRMGYKTEAIDYYKKAIARIDVKTELDAVDVSHLQSKISRAEGASEY